MMSSNEMFKVAVSGAQSTTNHTKPEVMQVLHAVIHERLFGNGPWLADGEILSALNKKVEALGLVEPVPDDPYSMRLTPLGKEVKCDLMLVFKGVWEPCEIPIILEEYEFISEDEATEIYKLLEEEGYEIVLRPIVRRAFLQHFQETGVT